MIALNLRRFYRDIYECLKSSGLSPQINFISKDERSGINVVINNISSDYEVFDVEANIKKTLLSLIGYGNFDSSRDPDTKSFSLDYFPLKKEKSIETTTSIVKEKPHYRTASKTYFK